MKKHKFSISISGTQTEATQKVNALAVLAGHLSAETLTALAKVVKEEPSKIALAKQYLGIK
jgi:hypothetical protein